MSSTTVTSQTPSVATTITPPNWVNDKCHTLNTLTCSICCDVSMDPVVTPCDHIFCRSCIHQSLHRNRFCPNDRTPLRASQVQELTGPIKRIWAQTPVQCPECEVWTGPLQTYCTEHGVTCVSPQKRIQALEDKLTAAEAQYQTTVQNYQTQIQTLQVQLTNALRAGQAENIVINSNNNNQTKRIRTPKPYYSSVTGPFGPFGTQQPPPAPLAANSLGQPQSNITFGQSSNIFTPPNPFHTSQSLPTTTTFTSTISNQGGVTVQFSIGASPPTLSTPTVYPGRRIVRARRPTY